MEIKRLRAEGHRITALDESRFWRLVTTPRSARPKPAGTAARRPRAPR